MKKVLFNFALIIPVLNAIAMITADYFPEKVLHPGTIRAVLIILFYTILFLYGFKKNQVCDLVIGFLVYLFVLTLINDRILNTIYIYIKIAISTMAIVIGYEYFGNNRNLVKLNRVNTLCLTMMVANVIVANIFHLGTSDYLDETIYFGAARVNITKTMTIILLLFPLFIRMEKSRKWINISLVVFILALIIVLVGIKRSALLALFFGYFIYFIFTPYRNKFLKRMFTILFILILSSSFLFEIFKSRIEARKEQILVTNPEFMEKEARVNEVNMVFSDIKRRPLYGVLFGRSFLNEHSYYNTNRMLHIDYCILLHGTGLMGIVIYFMIYYSIVKVTARYRLMGKEYSEIFALTISLITANLIVGIAGSLYSTDLRTTVMMYLGAFMRLEKEAKKITTHQNNI